MAAKCLGDLSLSPPQREHGFIEEFASWNECHRSHRWEQLPNSCGAIHTYVGGEEEQVYSNCNFRGQWARCFVLPQPGINFPLFPFPGCKKICNVIPSSVLAHRLALFWEDSNLFIRYFHIQSSLRPLARRPGPQFLQLPAIANCIYLYSCEQFAMTVISSSLRSRNTQ